MPTESIVFDPEIPDRELDREASKVDERLAESGQIQPEIGDVDGDLGMGDLGGGGIGGGRGGGRRGGGMGGGMGGGGAAAGLASRIPKPIAGVTTGAALPIALAGAVGVGLLGAMQNASARMQTSTKLLGQAWNNLFRPLGDKLDQLFIRDLATELVDETQKFEETLRNGEWAQAITGLVGDITTEGLSALPASSIIGAMFPAALGPQLIGIISNNIPKFTWPSLPSFPGWPSIKTDWPGWPSIDTQWPGWPTVKTDWPGWPNVQSEWDKIGWPDIGAPEWPSSGDILDKFDPVSASDIAERIIGREGRDPHGTGSPNGNQIGGGGGGLLGPLLPQGPLIPPVATGGRVADSGVARVHKDEIIAPEDRLVDELSAAINQQSGGGGTADVDTSAVENKLDKLNRNITQLAQAMQSMNIEVDKETLGRMASEGQREDVTDTDPLVR